VADLVAVLGVPQPKASRHLACLRRAGFVEARESGTWSFYRLARPASALHRRLLEAARAAPGPGADARRDRDLRRRGGCCP
jgi:ArsR family transcriptional regulator